jgi:16S rRNA (cytosine967-C5)-methyltransferase
MGVDAVRAAAVRVLLRTLEDKAPLDSALDRALRRNPLTERGRRFLTQLAYTTTRHKLLCDYILGQILDSSLDTLPAAIRAILRMGVAQRLFLNQVTTPAAVHTSVELARQFGHAGLARLVNAVLRRVPDTLDEITFPSREKEFSAYISVRYSLPLWLIEYMLRHFTQEEVEQFARSKAQEAPITLRVNTLLIEVEPLMRRLTEHGFPCVKSTAIPEELTLTAHKSPLASKYFTQGYFQIQDAASILVPHALQPNAGDWVLDLCAAPGSKTTHIAALTQKRAHIVAVDKDARRLHLVCENVERLRAENVYPVAAEGTAVPLRAGTFDCVLVDAPCSGLGTLRRHPDIKWRLQPEAISRLAETQWALLRSAVSLCKNGGVILYSVCTFTPEETIHIVEKATRQLPVTPEDGPELIQPWRKTKGQYRTPLDDDILDVFFLMRLRKQS